MKPTEQQEQCVELFASGQSLKVNAYAGTGKTSTLVLMGSASRRAGTYLAFNKSIATEAKTKFSRLVACSTTHGLAFRALVNKYGAERMVGNINAGFIAMKVRGIPQETFIRHDMTLTKRGRASLIVQTIARWLRSDREALGPWDVPFSGALELLTAAEKSELAGEILRDARAVWERMSSPDGDLPLTHDGYLKLWALSRPTIAGEFIFLDEAQDTNGVVMGLVRHQSAQLIVVGDRWQQIYEWRGAKDAMTELPAKNEARLSQSWRFGPNVAANASRYLELLGESVPLTGNVAKNDVVGLVENPEAIVCRTNATLLENVFREIGDGRRPHVVGGTTEIEVGLRAVDKLMNGQSVEHPDFIGFKDWNAVVEAASFEKEGVDEIRRWVALVEKYGVDELSDVLSKLPKTESGADVVISTGHKSKGREWERVRLTDDFLSGVSENEGAVSLGDYKAELRLLYVAATRGMTAVEINSETNRRVALIEKALAGTYELQAAE